MAASLHGDTPYSGKAVTSVSVTPYTTSVDVNRDGYVPFLNRSLDSRSRLSPVGRTPFCAWRARVRSWPSRSPTGQPGADRMGAERF